MNKNLRNTFEQFCYLVGHNILIEEGGGEPVLLCLTVCEHAKDGKCRNSRILKMLKE